MVLPSSVQACAADCLRWKFASTAGEHGPSTLVVEAKSPRRRQPLPASGSTSSLARRCADFGRTRDVEGAMLLTRWYGARGFLSHGVSNGFRQRPEARCGGYSRTLEWWSHGRTAARRAASFTLFLA